MRIVIDMQGAQASNAKRGIGRYVMALAKAIVRNKGENEILLALNGMLPESVEHIRAAFYGLLAQEDIRVWHGVGPVAFADVNNQQRREAAEFVREAFLASLRPDLVLVSSLFEGLGDDAVTSVGLLSEDIPTAVVLYDLIPLIHCTPYLENPVVRNWYFEKVDALKRADLQLSISESSRDESVEYLSTDKDIVTNISSDVDPFFRKVSVPTKQLSNLAHRYGLERPFVMYTGGIDHRKNIEGLIRAFALLPKATRKDHQLAVVCSVQPHDRNLLEKLAAEHRLAADDFVLTGFVPEDDLLALYNLCSLFVFPSWHEGFGLPALEAMRCGAPVIGANTSSLPEVLGWDEALFNPYSDEAIATKIERALTDDQFRAALKKNAAQQSKAFSWDQTAKCAILAAECFHSKRQRAPASATDAAHRPKLAYVSPLPPERTGIADYSVELLPELAEYYDIEVIVDQQQVVMNGDHPHFVERSPDWLRQKADQYDRVVYHFGNSTFHQHMFDLLEEVPGVVVLHDFFLSGVAAYMDLNGCTPGSWAQELFNAHGYHALHDRYALADVDEVIWRYPSNLSVAQNALGLIVHSENSKRLARQWYGVDCADWDVIPLLRDPAPSNTGKRARQKLGFGINDFVLCSFGVLGATKLNHRLLEAWLKSNLADDPRSHLVFVGENVSGGYGEALSAKIKRAKERSRIKITGWTEQEEFRQHLSAADVGVQLRTLSRGETSATVLDCMNYSVATIVNGNGSMADLDPEGVWKLPDKFTDAELIEALETLRHNSEKRANLGSAARKIILERHAPDACAEAYRDAIEGFYQSAPATLPELSKAIAKCRTSVPDDNATARLAEAMARSFPPKNNVRQLLVDVSELVQRDARTGIQRVVRNVLKEWLQHPPQGYRVEPVYADVSQGYRYARQFTLQFLGLPENLLADEPIDFAAGDVFFGLDLQPQVQTAHADFYQELRRQGVCVKFMVYDLLCIQYPEHFIPGAEAEFTPWLHVVGESDGAVCISKATADALSNWMDGVSFQRQRPFDIQYSHLGADLDKPTTDKAEPEEPDELLAKLRASDSFLMVGTLEPRKGHAQVLAAFEELWTKREKVNLVLVGKQGWMVEELVDRLRSHPEWRQKLFWLESINDEYLERVYAASSSLIAASYGEGFGLPLIEAAQHGLPIIARDLPVFREIAGDHAFYFSAEDAEGLAESINAWRTLRQKIQHPKSGDMPWLTWQESAQRIFEVVVPGVHHGSGSGEANIAVSSAA